MKRLMTLRWPLPSALIKHRAAAVEDAPAELLVEVTEMPGEFVEHQHDPPESR